MSSTSTTVSSALDDMFERPNGLYGSFDDLPVISSKGHFRRIELLEQLDIGDVTKMRIADFGMGNWGFAAIYPRLHDCALAVGLDISNTAIAMSRALIEQTQPKYGARFQAYQSDGMTLPLADASIDLFFSGESIEHVKFPPRFLSEIYRVLKEDGQLVITTPNRDAIKYKEQNEEYCTSPEHFWLFNYEELIETLSEFFEIKETYGFNGSFGSHDEDRAIRDEAVALDWSRKFEHEPQLATGVVLRLIKKPGIAKRYEIEDVPAANIAITGSNTYLDLEFGLKGLLLDQEGQSVTVRRPASDGVVCRFWCHRWSGFAAIDAGDRQHRFDLYSFVPGWKNWVFSQPSVADTQIQIRPTGDKNPKSSAPQVLFFEAFTWRVTTREATAPQASSKIADQRSLPGYGFERYKPFVGTTVFHWFEPHEGNVRGPWPPIGGRHSWTGKIDFWVDQIKQMMLANIDAIYLHCIEKYEDTRIEFFKAYAQLRAEGYDVPKVAPFLDPNILFGPDTIDVGTTAGKDEFARHYIRFFKQYFNENTDANAASFLLTIDGRLVLTTWWVYWLLQNVEALTREDVRSRLAADLSTAIPQLSNGIYMMTTALIDPDLSFADERAVMFSGYAYAIHAVHQGIDVWHVQPGYWDQNIRQPGYCLPRDGGKNYKRAWDAVVSAMPHVHRVYVESWNEYDEGSGIYAADPDGLFIDRAMHSTTDVFSDAGDPYEYVLTTAEGAAKINGRPNYDAEILWHDAPVASKSGETVRFSVTVRNRGNSRWVTGEECALLLLGADGIEHARIPLDDGFGSEAASHRGIFRGQPVTFSVETRAPDAGSAWKFTAVMTRQGLILGKGQSVFVKLEAPDA
jgi:SAM-dependent methyltransferase